MTNIAGCAPSYDNNGNVLNDCLHSYTWDAYGRPTTIDSVNLTYGAFGRMVEQNRSGAYTQIAYSTTGFRIAILNGQSYTTAFVPLAGGVMGVWATQGVYLRHPDWLGSSRLASNYNRTVYYDGAYAPFGEPYAQSGTTDLNFTGMDQDTISGLYDFPAREYSIQGRWPSPDPAGLAAVDPTNPQSWNRYSYVMNDPLDWVDPSGLDPCPNDNSWGAQLCRQAQAFRSTTFYNTWNAFSLVFTTGCSESGCVTTIDPNAFNLLLGLLHSSGNSSGSAQQPAPSISPAAQACANQANQQIQNQLQTFSGYAGTKLLGRALIGGGLGAVRGFYKAAQTDSPWIIASSATVGAAIGVGWNILSDINTIRNIQNSFMNKFVACVQNAFVPKPPE